jgi:hypothetical protein
MATKGGASDAEAKFSIQADSNLEEVGEEGARSLEELKDQIRGSTDKLREYANTLKSLRGTTKAVTAARDELLGTIENEKRKITGAQLALVKQGTSYQRLTELAKKQRQELENRAIETAKKRTDALREALSQAGGPLADMSSQLKSAQTILAGGGGYVFLVAAAAAAVVALTAATIAGAISLARWTIEAANANRALSLVREAASGSAANAEALGTQIDALWRKIPTGRDALNELASTITKTFSGSQVSGQGIVDTFNAVASASAAMGDEVGSQLRGIVERGKTFGRVGIGLNELQGTGLNLTDVAGPLAKQMKIGVDAARQALVYGLVPVNDAAAAIRDAVEKRFGEINAKKLLDLNVIVAKFHDRITALARGFNLEPILRSLEKLSSLFDEATVTGAALQQLVSIFGTILGATFEEGTPLVQAFFEELIIHAQQAAIWLLKNANTVRSWVAAFTDNIPSANTVLAVLIGTVTALTVAAGALAIATIEIWGPIAAIAVAAGLAGAALYKFSEWLSTFNGKSAIENFVELGKGIVWGLINGMTGGIPEIVSAVGRLGKAAWDALRKFWDAHSPSRRSFGLGQDIAEGKALGIEDNADRVAEAATSSGRAGAGAMAGGGGGGGLAGARISVGQITLVVQVAPGTNATDQGKAAAASFYAQLLELVEGLGAAEGIPMQGSTT